MTVLSGVSDASAALAPRIEAERGEHGYVIIVTAFEPPAVIAGFNEEGRLGVRFLPACRARGGRTPGHRRIERLTSGKTSTTFTSRACDGQHRSPLFPDESRVGTGTN